MERRRKRPGSKKETKWMKQEEEEGEDTIIDQMKREEAAARSRSRYVEVQGTFDWKVNDKCETMVDGLWRPAHIKKIKRGHPYVQVEDMLGTLYNQKLRVRREFYEKRMSQEGIDDDDDDEGPGLNQQSAATSLRIKSAASVKDRGSKAQSLAAKNAREKQRQRLLASKKQERIEAIERKKKEEQRKKLQQKQQIQRKRVAKKRVQAQRPKKKIRVESHLPLEKKREEEVVQKELKLLVESMEFQDLIKSIISTGREKGEELTKRKIRSKIEAQLELPAGTLNKAKKTISKYIDNAMSDG
mmetsp:Transcript_11759/g.16433  ORF Transcript_11759/g.16433 Transcript_11759/m.16433 type:complete len:300 (+) Transcript_11759:323-1222(+)